MRAVSAREGATAAVDEAVEGEAEGEVAVDAGVVMVVARLPIARAGEAHHLKCGPSGNAPTSKSKRF
jgi:hypothetical protein